MDSRLRGSDSIFDFLRDHHIFSDDLSNRLPEILSLLKSLSDKQSGLEYLETILKYLASGTDKVGAEDIKNAECTGRYASCSSCPPPAL